ncbi:MAG: hypothetical protein K2W96_10990 [Gemmataceae bacterium]|nr:hypothetical protein [Gemmataceae bacterium]
MRNRLSRRRWFWPVVALIDAVTWIGGWIAHQRDLAQAAGELYRRMQDRNREDHGEENGPDRPIWARLHESGPWTRVNWCFPLLPGVLLAESAEGYGPLRAHGSFKLVVW